MKTLRAFLEMVRFHHTIFALPFAYLGMVLAANWPPAGGPPQWPTLRQVVLITLAMVAARTLAFAVNHYADWRYDARNPRTAGRPIPSGRLSARAALAYGGIALALLAVAAWLLNPLTLLLLPGAIIFLVGYSFTKRFTWLCHWILGATDGLAPAGAWVAVRGAIDPPAWLLWLAVTMWVAGFDLIYSSQDSDFDRSQGLFSMAANFGVAASLRWAKISHAIAVGSLVVFGLIFPLNWIYWLGVAIVAALLAYENLLVTPRDLSRIDTAMFNVNAYVAVIIFAASLGALYL